MTATSIVILVVAIVVLAAALWMFIRSRKTKELRSRFGPEYENVVHEYGDRTKAETELERRARRVERFHIRMLSETERTHFAEEWHRTQSEFVDDPPSAIRDADELVMRVMESRGYPMADFDRRAEDVSVDHPHVVNNYRQAHAIAVRHRQGEADTEDLRKAMVCYRELFDELLETHPAAHRR